MMGTSISSLQGWVTQTLDHYVQGVTGMEDPTDFLGTVAKHLGLSADLIGPFQPLMPHWQTLRRQGQEDFAWDVAYVFGRISFENMRDMLKLTTGVVTCEEDADRFFAAARRKGFCIRAGPQIYDLSPVPASSECGLWPHRVQFPEGEFVRAVLQARNHFAVFAAVHKLPQCVAWFVWNSHEEGILEALTTVMDRLDEWPLCFTPKWAFQLYRAFVVPGSQLDALTISDHVHWMHRSRAATESRLGDLGEVKFVASQHLLRVLHNFTLTGDPVRIARWLTSPLFRIFVADGAVAQPCTDDLLVWKCLLHSLVPFTNSVDEDYVTALVNLYPSARAALPVVLVELVSCGDFENSEALLEWCQSSELSGGVGWFHTQLCLGLLAGSALFFPPGSAPGSDSDAAVTFALKTLGLAEVGDIGYETPGFIDICMKSGSPDVTDLILQCLLDPFLNTRECVVVAMIRAVHDGPFRGTLTAKVAAIFRACLVRGHYEAARFLYASDNAFAQSLRQIGERAPEQEGQGGPRSFDDFLLNTKLVSGHAYGPARPVDFYGFTWSPFIMTALAFTSPLSLQARLPCTVTETQRQCLLVSALKGTFVFDSSRLPSQENAATLLQCTLGVHMPAHFSSPVAFYGSF
jgi:hypothetical protein